VQELLDLPRVDVLSTTDDHVFQPSDDVDVAVVAHDGEIARVHPARRVDGRRGRVRIAPVPEHDGIASRAELTRLPARHDDTGVVVDDLALDVGMNTSDGGEPV